MPSPPVTYVRTRRAEPAADRSVPLSREDLPREEVLRAVRRPRPGARAGRVRNRGNRPVWSWVEGSVHSDGADLADGGWRPPASHAMLLGRGAECEPVEQVLGQARNGRSAAAHVIRGEAGIGKTAAAARPQRRDRIGQSEVGVLRQRHQGAHHPLRTSKGSGADTPRHPPRRRPRHPSCRRRPRPPARPTSLGPAAGTPRSGRRPGPASSGRLLTEPRIGRNSGRCHGEHDGSAGGGLGHRDVVDRTLLPTRGHRGRRAVGDLPVFDQPAGRCRRRCHDRGFVAVTLGRYRAGPVGTTPLRRVCRMPGPYRLE
ncbi:hypothetical protein B0I33_11047 [Prauserella shujinwangii]|uniref:Uncharacterized protein n=1 Tax=Prauserella shujinwangii TaxID=1453103 RepID=A0A2T0LNX8_9PSEU|nr:hypothetical protein B0I33_11047 [Prauserella shujinwangii]